MVIFDWISPLMELLFPEDELTQDLMGWLIAILGILIVLIILQVQEG